MRLPSIAAIAAAPCLVVLASPATAFGGNLQLHGGFTGGFAFSSGPLGGIGGSTGLQGAFTFGDVFRLYGALDYSLQVGPDPANTPRQSGTLAAGLAYALDVLSIVPWFGLGLQLGVVGTPTWVGVLPAAEARVGLDWFTSRYVALTLQIYYGLVFADRQASSDTFGITLGVRFTADL